MQESNNTSTHTLRRTFWDPKKRLLGSHPQRSGDLFPVTSSECSRCSPARSRRTVRGSSDDRSWFGRPQAIRKGGRECRQQQGDERVGNAGLSPAAPPSSVSKRRRGCCLRTAKKKRGPTPSQFDAFAPSPKKQSKDYAGFTY